MKKKSALVVATLILSACSNPGIVKLSPDTYMLSREAHGGIFESTSELKAGVITDANAFAEGQGKVAIPISAKEVPRGNGPAQWASFDYQFRVVDKNDPEVRRTSLVPRADVVIEKTENISADVKVTEHPVATTDVYSELIKLDDLRKRGILTAAEFETQKRKLLESK